MRADVILTNPSGTTGETVARSLRNRGVRVVVMEAPNARKMEDSYVARLHKFVAEYHPDTIWPIFFTDVLARHRNEFPSVSIPLDRESVILTLDNKLECCRLAESLGIRQPRMFASSGDVREFPVVFKRVMGLGGDSVYFPRNPRALRNLAGTAGGYIISEYVEGDDVSIDAVRWGDYFYGAAYRVLEPRRKGVSLRRISIDAPELVETLRRILDAIDYRGVCGADFRVTPDGTAYFLECNPRFCGGLESAVASGFDLPWIYWQLTHGMTPDPVTFTAGIITGTDGTGADGIATGTDSTGADGNFSGTDGTGASVSVKGTAGNLSFTAGIITGTDGTGADGSVKGTAGNLSGTDGTGADGNLKGTDVS